MQILYIFMALVGFTMLYFGIKWMYQFFTTRKVIEFPLTEKTAEFLLDKGLYAFCMVGVRYARNIGDFKIWLASDRDRRALEKSSVGVNFSHNGSPAVQYSTFTVEQFGMYTVVLENIDKLKAKGSRLFFTRMLQSDIEPERIRILIKETLPFERIFLGIIFLVLGVNILVWGIILSFNPDIFL